VDEVEHCPSLDLELMAADETLEVDEDVRSVQSLHAKDGGLVEWQDVVGQEPETTTATTTTTAAEGRRQARGDVVVDDDDAVFGELVVCELRHVTDLETKLILRHNILTMIYETRLSCLQGARPGGGHQPPRTSLRPGDRGDQRSLPTISGCWSSSRRSHNTHNDVDSADVVLRRQNHADADNGMIMIKEEM